MAGRSDSTWLAAANADIELTPGALQTLLDASTDHPNAGAIAPQLILPDGSTQQSVHRFPSPSLAAVFSTHSLSSSISPDCSAIERNWPAVRMVPSGCRVPCICVSHSSGNLPAA